MSRGFRNFFLLRNRESGIGNRESGIGNRESGIVIKLIVGWAVFHTDKISL
ncbi:MAG: hypothetical protein F6K65_27235 [Moorea sp. SIO3C2]|nr:hypothetical protein [Moorena sp. SIO3C2]